MKKHICINLAAPQLLKKVFIAFSLHKFSIIAGLCAVAFSLTSCSDDFLEVKNPTGEPLEEYYTTEETLNEALTAAYAPLHWPDWDGTAYNDLTVHG